jgi:hypothetical protein
MIPSYGAKQAFSSGIVFGRFASCFGFWCVAGYGFGFAEKEGDVGGRGEEEAGRDVGGGEEGGSEELGRREEGGGGEDGGSEEEG